MATLDDPWEPEDTIPGNQPGPAPSDRPLPQVAEVPRHLPPIVDAAGATERMLDSAAEQQSNLFQPAPIAPATAPDGTPLPPNTAWATIPGVGPGGPYTRRVTEGPVPDWIPERARWQALAFRRERVPGGYQGPDPLARPTPVVPERSPNAGTQPQGLDTVPLPDAETAARDTEQDLDPGTAAARNVSWSASAFNAYAQAHARAGGADIPRGAQIIAGQREGPLQRTADEVDRLLDEQFPINPEHRDHWFVNLFAPAVGNVTGIVQTLFIAAGISAATGLTGAPAAAGGVVAAGVGIGSRALSALRATPYVGALVGRNASQTAARIGLVGVTSFPQNGAEQFRDAVQHGASFDDVIMSARLNGAIGGALDALPVFRALSALDATTGNAVQRAIARGVGNTGYRLLETGISEAGTEMLQNITSNFIASGIVRYDPNRDWYEGLPGSGIGGFTGGALLQALLMMLPGGRRVHAPGGGGAGTTGTAVGAPAPGAPPGWGSGAGGASMGGLGGPGGPGPGLGGGPPGLPGPGQGGGQPGQEGDGFEFSQPRTGIEGREEQYFALPPREDRTAFLRAQQQRIRDIDAAWKKSRPDYVGDPIVGNSLEFYNYLIQSEADFERMRNMAPERAAQPDVQARMQEIQANREVIDLLRDPVRMVNRPVWVLQRPPSKGQRGQTIFLANGADGKPISRSGGKQRLVGQDGKDYFVGSGTVMQLDNVAPENLVLSPQGQHLVRLARMRMEADAAAKDAQVRAEQQAALDTSGGQARTGRDPRAAQPAARGTQLGLNLQREGEVSPEQQAADQAVKDATKRQTSTTFTEAGATSTKPETAPAGIKHEPLKPPPLTEQEQLELEGLTQTSGQAAAATKRTSETITAAKATLTPKRVTLEELPGKLRQQLDMRAVRLGIKLPEVFSQQDLVDAGMPASEAGAFFRKIEKSSSAAAARKLAQGKANMRRTIKRGIDGIMEFYKDLPSRERRAIRKMLQHFERHIGPSLSELDIIDFANWASAADATLAKQGAEPMNFNDPNTAAEYVSGRFRALGDGIRRAAIAMRSEEATAGSRANAVRLLAHELTHFMVGLSQHTDADMARLWEKLTLNMSNDPTYKEVLHLYDTEPKVGEDPDLGPANLAHEFLAKKVEAAMGGRYETSFEKAAPGQDQSLGTYIKEFIRRIVEFVSDAYDWVLGQDIITQVFNNVAQETGVDMSSYMVDVWDASPDPYTGERVMSTDAERRAKKGSGDANNVLARTAAANYFAVLYKGKNHRKRFESGMVSQFGDTWLDLPLETRTKIYDAAVETTKDYDIKAAYKFNVLLGAPQNLTAFVRLLGLAKDGDGADGSGRKWYELTAEVVSGRFGDWAIQFMKYLAATSPGQAVGGNTTQTLSAMAQAFIRPHLPIGVDPELGIKQVGFETSMVIANSIKQTGDWSKSAQKTQAFFRAMAQHLHITEDFVAVVDRWMMRALGFDSDNPTPQQFEHARLLITAIADALGWKVEEAQAAIWCGIKLESTRKADKDVRNYGDFIKLSDRVLHYEIAPSTKRLVGEMFAAMPFSWRKRVTERVVREIMPGLVETYGAHVFNPLFSVASGGYMSQQNPSIETRVPMPDWAVEGLAHAIGYVTIQDGILITRLAGYGDWLKKPTAMVAITLPGSDAVSPEQAMDVWNHVMKVDPSLQGGYAVQGNKVLFFNLSGEEFDRLRRAPFIPLDDNAFHAALKAAVATYPGAETLEMSPPGHADARLIGNDWKEKPHGEDYHEALERIRPGLADQLHLYRAKTESILAEEFDALNIQLPRENDDNTLGGQVTPSIPVGGPIDVRDGAARIPTGKKARAEVDAYFQNSSEFAGIDPGPFAQMQIYSRFGKLQPGLDTTPHLKKYNLDKPLADPEGFAEWQKQFGINLKYFSFVSIPELGVEHVLPRPRTDGYHKGTLWIYDPRVPDASFKDIDYTRIWRIFHELAHGITEQLMQSKYGKSRRYGRLGRMMKGELGKEGKQVEVDLKELSLSEAMRAVHWEDVAFRAQRMLMQDYGIQITDAEFAQEYNINIGDATYRVITGEFGSPGEYGFVPATEKQDINEILYMVENAEHAIADVQERNPTTSIARVQMTEITDDDIMALITKAKAEGLAAVAVNPKDDYPGETFTDSNPGETEDMYTERVYSNLRAAVQSSPLLTGTAGQWNADFDKATRNVPLIERQWSGIMNWMKNRAGYGPVERGRVVNYVNAAEMMIDSRTPGLLVLRSNPSDKARTEVEIGYRSRTDTHNRVLMEITSVGTNSTRERTTLAVRRAIQYFAKEEVDGVVVTAALDVKTTDPNWKKDGRYIAQDLGTGVQFRARLDPKTNTAFISMIYLPPTARGTGKGTEIVNRFEKTAAEAGVRRIEGEAVPPSVPFWQSRGYIVSPRLNAKGMHPMTKYVGPIDEAAQKIANKEKDITANEVLEQIARDFGTAVQNVSVANQDPEQSMSPASEAAQEAPVMVAGRAFIFPQAVQNNAESDVADVYRKAVRRPPGYQPPPASTAWHPWWSRYSRALLSLDYAFMQSSKQIRQLSGWMPSGYKLGNHFRRDPWMHTAPKTTGVIGEDYHGVVQGVYGPQLEKLRQRMQTLSTEAIQEIPYALRGSNINPATGKVGLTHLSLADAIWLRAWLDEVLDFTNVHMRGHSRFGTADGANYVTAKNAIAKLPNYFPQLWELEGKFRTGPFAGAPKEEVAHAFFKALNFHPGARQDEDITDMINNLMGDGGFVSYAQTGQWRTAPVTVLTNRIRDRLLKIDASLSIPVTVGGVTANVSINDLLNNNPMTILPRYAIGMARQGEFYRRFGPKGEVISNLVTAIQQERRAAGMAPLAGKELFRLIKQVQANLNSLPVRPSREWNRRQELLKMSVNTNMLFFTTFASLPEALMPLARLGLRGQLSAFVGGIKQILSTVTRHGDTDARRIARDLGIIREQFHSTILDYASSHATFALGRWNVDTNRVSDTVFKYTALTAWTNFTRTMAVHAAIRSLPYWAEKAQAGGPFARHYARWLQEVGLTPQDMAGFDPDLYTAGVDVKIDAAIRQMAQEMVIEGTPGMKPGWMSDPRFKLVAQIKSFIVTYGNTVIQRPIREVSYGNPMPIIWMVAFAASAALMGELWEWWLWGDAGNPSWHRAGIDDPNTKFLMRMMSRGGIAGPYQFIVDMITMGRSMQGGTSMGQFVPAATIADRLANFIASGARWIRSGGDNPRAVHEMMNNATLLVPGLSQSGAFRRYLVDSMAPSPGQPPTPFPTWTGTPVPPGGRPRGGPSDPYGGGGRRDPYSGGRGRDPYGAGR